MRRFAAMRRLRRILLGAMAGLGALALVPTAAEAHGYWYGPGPGFYRPPPPRYWRPPPPPPVYYRPPPAYYGPPPAYFPPPRYYAPPPPPPPPAYGYYRGW